MVIGAEQVDADVETASALVDVVSSVRGEVGELTVCLDEHSVFIVVEFTRAQPCCAI